MPRGSKAERRRVKNRVRALRMKYLDEAGVVSCPLCHALVKVKELYDHIAVHQTATR